MRIVDMLWEFYLYQLLNRQHPIPPTHKEMEHLATQNVTFWFSESMSLKNVVYALSFFPFAITMISISIFYQTHSTYLLYTCITSFGALSIQWAFTMTSDVLLAEAAAEGQLGTLLHRFPGCAVRPNAHPNSLLIDVLLFLLPEM